MRRKPKTEQLRFWDEAELPEGATTYHHNRRQRARGFLVLAVLVMVAVGFRPTSFVQMQPGPVRAVAMAPSPPDGEFDAGRWNFTTVQVVELNGFEWLYNRLAGNASDIVPSLGTLDPESAARDKFLMNNSKRLAWAAANSLAGTDAEGVAPVGVDVVAVEAGSAAEKAGMEIGDRILSVNGVQADRAEVVQDQVAAAGTEPVALDLDASTSEVPTLYVTPEMGSDGPRLGVQLVEHGGAGDPPYNINSDNVSGPSAGMIFALAYLDALGPGDLSAGMKIAGTGTVDASGDVGAIGGVEHKVHGAINDGADVFFVDEGDFSEAAHAGAGRIEVVAVTTVAQAAGWLCDRGADDQYCG